MLTFSYLGLRLEVQVLGFRAQGLKCLSKMPSKILPRDHYQPVVLSIASTAGDIPWVGYGLRLSSLWVVVITWTL